jgi:hypothetical protein
MNTRRPADPEPEPSIYDDEPMKPGSEFVLPREPRRRFAVWIDGRLQTKLVTAKSEKVAVEIVHLKWGVDRRSHVVVKPKFPVDHYGRKETPEEHRGPSSTPAEGMAFKLGRVLIGWTTKVAERRASITTAQRIFLEEGRATAAVKEAAFRALVAQGVPVATLVQVATDFFEHQRLLGKPTVSGKASAPGRARVKE